MSKGFNKYLFSTLLLLCAGLSSYAAPARWEAVKTERTDAKTVVKETEIEIRTADSTIIVISNHTVQIKIFTILGRLVSNEILQPGISQISLPAHGVYLVKTGNITCKVAI
ncbi:MAG: T9SS type A sorting domain-containing protein [Muribaculaceae bacterium]|nr:T9SS type A sorting domain-containing protein [Muribaculaceae bacterium]MDE6537595.1 T9SS type A sorting domain-containing protein [Muribaculaceae bacterium]MDE6836508.1 T9SS type A sorting domain-containing protein [Muribaculaceae bacterium]